MKELAPSSQPSFRYRAFLSYRTADTRIATKLHRALENYRIPRPLIGRETEFGVITKKLGTIFRDRDDARTEEDIDTIIAQELSKSQHLIVVCTPKTREADSWVSREIEIFRDRRPKGKIHAVIGDGEPPDCFPQAILVSNSGSLRQPLAADIRSRHKGGQDGFSRAVVKVAAGLTGLDFDDLWRRELRRTFRRRIIVGTSVVATLAGVAGVYIYTELSRFVREEGEYLVVYKGRIGLNPPGYPKRVWTLDAGTDRLQLQAGTDPRSYVVATGPGENVIAMLDGLIRPDYRAAEFYERGERESAKKLARELIANPRTSGEFRLNAKLVLAMAADGGDADEMRTMLTDERREVRFAAARALFRFDAETALADAQALPKREIAGLDVDLTQLAQPPCGKGLRQFFTEAFQTTSNLPSNSDLIDAVIRTKCEIGTEALLIGLQRPSMPGDGSIPLYAELSGQSSALAEAVYKELSLGKLDEWRLGGLFEALRRLPDVPCQIVTLRRGLASQIELTRLQAIATIGKICADFSVDFMRSSDTSITVQLRQKEGSGNAEDRVEVTRGGLSIQARLLATMLTEHRPRDASTMLRDLLTSAEDDPLRAEAIRSLTILGDRDPLPPGLLEANNLDVRQAGIEHDRARNELAVIAKLRNMIGSTDLFFAAQLGRIKSAANDMSEILPMLAGGGYSRGQAACILGMQAPVSTVVMLLTNADAEIRKRTASCAPYNAAATLIIEQMPQHVGDFPLSYYHNLRSQVAARTELEVQLIQLTPRQRLERLEALDLTPGGFGRWQEGMRYWIQEQRYQLSLANTKH